MSLAAKDSLFRAKLRVINVGLPQFADGLRQAGFDVAQVSWKPPAGGDPELLRLLQRVERCRPQIDAANRRAVQRIVESNPVLIDLGLAGAVIPGYPERSLLHAGPPLSWPEVSGPVKGAVLGAILYEGWAETFAAAEVLMDSGQVTLRPCHEFETVGPMAGIVSPSMPVFVVKNAIYNTTAFATMNEGLGNVLRFGACGPEVLQRLRWMKAVLFPILSDAVRLLGKVALREITSQALQMGDECHNRNKAATGLLLRQLSPAVLTLPYPLKDIRDVIEFVGSNEHFYLNLSMAAAKASLDAAHGIPFSTVVTAMARNGTDFGIRVSGLSETWFSAPAPTVEGLFFPGFSEADANPDLGDSAITETAGLGGFAMACAPAIVNFVGGRAADALAFSKTMYGITVGESHYFKIPALDFRGTPTGIDVLKVLWKDVLPVINTGIAHKAAGIGQIGAGLVRPPLDCFKAALADFVDRYVEGGREGDDAS